MKGTRLWFVRHGEVEAPYVGTFLGTTDARLSPTGRHQAEAIKEYLRDAPLEAILASPRMRSRETVAHLAHELGLKVELRPALAEMDFGQWETLRWPDIEAKDGEYAKKWQDDPATNACPGGESCDHFYGRVHQEILKLKEEFAGRTILIGAHAGTNRCILGHVLERPYLDCMKFAQDYGCVNAVGWTQDGFGQVAMVNFVPGPRSEEQGD